MRIMKPLNLSVNFSVLFLMGCAVLGANAEEAFWPYGSASYTNKESWQKICAENPYDDKVYLIGTDIVACVTKAPDGSIYGLIMSPAFNFSEPELAKMHNSTEMPELPLRNHSRFKCLRLTSGWMC